MSDVIRMDAADGNKIFPIASYMGDVVWDEYAGNQYDSLVLVRTSVLREFVRGHTEGLVEGIRKAVCVNDIDEARVIRPILDEALNAMHRLSKVQNQYMYLTSMLTKP